MKGLVVSCNDPENSSFKLAVKAEIYDTVKLEPKDKISFTRVAEYPAVEELYLTNTDTEPINILSASSSKKNVSVKFETVEEGFKYRVLVILTSPLEGGRRETGFVTLNTDRKVNPDIKITVNQYMAAGGPQNPRARR